jgi:hypothetical protein
MNHYLGHHNAEEGGQFGHDGKLFTAKSFRPDTLIGNRLWVIEGRGTPRQCRMVSTGEIKAVTLEKRPEKSDLRERGRPH